MLLFTFRIQEINCLLLEFDAAVLGARHLHDAQRTLVEDEAVGIVVDDDEVVPACEVHEPPVEFGGGIGARRHVGIVGPHDFHAAQVHLLQCVEVRLPLPVLPQVVGDDFAAEQAVERGVGGVSGVGNEYLVARIDQCEGDMEDAFLRTDERLDFGVRIEFHIIEPSVPCCHRLSQFGDSDGGLVSVHVGLACGFAEHADGFVGRGHVGASDAQADDVLSLCIHACHLLEFPREVVFADGA